MLWAIDEALSILDLDEEDTILDEKDTQGQFLNDLKRPFSVTLQEEEK